MTFSLDNVITSSDTGLVHEAVIDACRTCSFVCDEDVVRVPVRFLASNPRLKNTESDYTDYNSQPRYPSITVFANQPTESGIQKIGFEKVLEETEAEPGHYDVVKYEYPQPFIFNYQINIASNRQDHQDLLGMKVKSLFKAAGGQRAITIKSRVYELLHSSLATRVFPEEGVQVEDLEWSITVPVVFLDRSQRLPMIEEFIINTGIPTWYESIDNVAEMEQILGS